jgi:hypothetical protein
VIAVALVVAFILGAFAWWALNALARSMAFGGRKIGSEVRQKWLAKLDYDALLRTKKQLDDEIARRQP